MLLGWVWEPHVRPQGRTAVYCLRHLRHTEGATECQPVTPFVTKSMSKLDGKLRYPKYDRRG